jgi:hypothetical protein
MKDEAIVPSGLLNHTIASILVIMYTIMLRAMSIHLNPEWITCYLECATYNFLKEQGAHELGQYLCAADKLYSDTFGWELMRTMNTRRRI